MSKKIFVGNLSWNVDADQLRELCSAYGNITDCVVMTDRDTGRSRGFAFVTFDTEEEAQAAVQGMNESEVDGRKLTVNMAKPKSKF